MFYKGICLENILVDVGTGISWSASSRAYELFGSDLMDRESAIITGTIKTFPNIRLMKHTDSPTVFQIIRIADWSHSDWLEAKRLGSTGSEFDSRVAIRQAIVPAIREDLELKSNFIHEIMEHGNLSKTLRTLEIPRARYNKWMQNDQDFYQAVIEVRESLIDDVESQLISNAKLGDSLSIKYFLDHKASDRGYGKNGKVAVEDKSEVDLDRLTYEEQEQLKFLLAKCTQKDSLTLLDT